jgi:hypothetical protein
MLRSLVSSTVLALAAFAAPALATGTVVTFDNSVNVGGWTYGPPNQFHPTGGNPGWWMGAAPDTFAPQLRTTSAHSPFTGNWRTAEVVSLGVDLITNSTQFPASRPLSVVLTGAGGCRVYFLGSSLVPQPGAGWKAFDFAIPSQSLTMPAGWAVLDGCADPDAAWNAVITNVTEVDFFYGDPTFFFIFDIWNVGADNPRIFSDPFNDLGNGLAGTNGTPVLAGSGSLAPGAPMGLTLTNALPNSSTTLVIGLISILLPFKGGVLVPNPDLVIFGLPTGPAGTLALNGTWPASIPSNVSFFFQHWVADPGGPAGFAASNGLKGTTP